MYSNAKCNETGNELEHRTGQQLSVTSMHSAKVADTASSNRHTCNSRYIQQQYTQPAPAHTRPNRVRAEVQGVNNTCTAAKAASESSTRWAICIIASADVTMC
jgi:hypothetical protein